jgi:YkoY family integral membrane protein
MVWNDVAVIGSLIVIEGLLSADNALVLAILVRHLPKSQQRKALRYGIWGAFFFRGVCLLLATWLIRAWYFKIAGALYLLYVGISHLIRHDPDHQQEKQQVSQASFWKTVLMVELTDLAFSIDSILAAVAMSDKLWVVYLGGISGIIAMRLVAGTFINLLERFPGLAVGAYLLVSWIGTKLLLEGWHSTAETFADRWGWSDTLVAQLTPIMPGALFWLGMAAIFFGSLVWHYKSNGGNTKTSGQ